MLTRTFESIETWAENLARLWVERLQAQPDIRICLAAGNTPVPVCEAMVRAYRAGDASFSKATIFALDEYGELNPEDAGR
ncbi:uncharacterized protein METZ01_LOCUS511061, partial [marine metagenome]